MTIHDLIRERRRAAGLTQRAFAKAIGRSHGLVGQWETELTKPPLADLPAIARALDMPVAEFLRLPGSPYRGELVEDPDELAALATWRGIHPKDRQNALALLHTMASFPTAHADRSEDRGAA